MKVSPGDVFGRLTVIENDKPRPGTRDRYVICRCVCGCSKSIYVSNLTSNKVNSCGCLRKELTSQAFLVHGQADKTPEYQSWLHIRSRCLIATNKSYPDYGGRGIKICARWDSFELFFEDMGQRPSPKHSIDRIDNNGDYCPENCRWATPKTQSNNKRNNHLIEYKGTTKTIAQWAEALSISRTTLRNRIVRGGWSVEKALTTPIKER